MQHPAFWIDVGGTFTDCLLRAPDGRITPFKLLSSGIFKATVAESTHQSTTIRCFGLSQAPRDFFSGFNFRSTAIINASQPSSGAPAKITVRTFDPVTQTLELDRPVSLPAQATFDLHGVEEAPVLAIRWLLGKSSSDAIGPIRLLLGTTRGTNALLERNGARCDLVMTVGLTDSLRIAFQNRPRLFDLHVRKPNDLFETVIAAQERISATGDIVLSLDEAKLEADLLASRARGVQSLAICLMNAYRNPEHEVRAKRIAERVGFTHISLSSELSPSQKLIPRGDTTVVNAYLSPIIANYVASIRRSLPEADFRLMTSAGGLVQAERFVGKDSVLSGPAGGAVGVAHVARAAGFKSAVGFDMGGTSTDTCRVDFARDDGPFERRQVMSVVDPESDAELRIVAPMISIETVAAGGGSVCWFDGQRLRVGPNSAGSNPGPACYGRGGPLAITDVNLYLGRVLPDRFAFPLDRHAVETRLDEVVQQLAQAGKSYSRERLAAAFVEIANANMSAALKKVSLARGHDIKHDALVSFGGAGGQHACALAKSLGMKVIIQHPYAGILSAYGIGMADVRRFAEQHVGQVLTPALPDELAPVFQDLETKARQEVLAEGVPAAQIQAGIRTYDLRYVGQESVIAITSKPGVDLRTAFEKQHHQQFGFTFPKRDLEVVAIRLEVIGATFQPAEEESALVAGKPSAIGTRQVWFDDTWHDTPIYQRDEIKPGQEILGPAIIIEPICTIVVEPDWRAFVNSRNHLLIEHLTPNIVPAQPDGLTDSASPDDAFDPLRLELFNNRMTSIAEQMGVTLQRTSLSTNVKERLDFSCAVFTAQGDLLCNAPHIPVHLGAMGETVKSLLHDIPDIAPGDVFVTNDPYRGGSHLPDITVLTPVHDPTDQRLLFFTGSRAHHAEIGGIVPGSMPPFSTNLAEEGVLIRTMRLVERGESKEAALEHVLTSAPFPTRSLEDNLADIRAQVAANRMGETLLLDLVAREGRAIVLGYAQSIRAAAAEKTKRLLGRMSAGEYRFADQLDNGRSIKVTITIKHEQPGIGSATVDFAGTDPVCTDNQHANPAIVRSAVLYCIRCLLNEPVPLNDGLLDPITLTIPENTLLRPIANADPTRCPAVGGGNVETSQRVVDVILGALGVVAASQGTMNNFLFGRKASAQQRGFGYYETIGGGTGAGEHFAGAHAVHSHMTNTRLTDPEVLEARYPVRLRTFAIRKGSGGAGAFAGGDGMIREIEFLEPVELSLVTNRRNRAPYGVAGGSSGQPGRNQLGRLESGTMVWSDLGSAVQQSLSAHDIIRIETPGGGGYGPSQSTR